MLKMGLAAPMKRFRVSLKQKQALQVPLRSKPVKRYLIIGIALTFAVIATIGVVDTNTTLDCEEGVVILQHRDGRAVMLVGTVHISEESAALVRRTIIKAKPNAVLVELDRKRINCLYSAETMPKRSAPAKKTLYGPHQILRSTGNIFAGLLLNPVQYIASSIVGNNCVVSSSTVAFSNFEVT